jgi:hypothetical protein
MEECMEMNGGGVWQLGPGQITDESEQSMSIIHGLLAGTDIENKTLDYNAIIFMYKQWVKSKPFDISEACENSIGGSIKQNTKVKPT